MAGGVLRSTNELQTLVPSFGGGREGVAVPFQFVFSGEDNLRVAIVNVVPDLTVVVESRFLPKEKAIIQANQQRIQARSDGIESTTVITMPAGVLLNLVVRAAGALTSRGQCYVRVDIVRGTTTAVVLGTLLAGYIGSYGGRAWPGSPLESPVEGPGYTRVY